MLSIDQLAHARALSVKISHLLDEIAALPAQASESGRIVSKSEAHSFFTDKVEGMEARH
jgi:hypothetical protein